MSGLILKLRPFETVMVNGAVIENGRRESRLRIATENVNVLRLREALEPHEVTSSLAEAYYAAQLAVTGATDPVAARTQVALALARHAEEDDGAQDAPAIAEAQSALSDGAFYRVMRALGPALRRGDAAS